MTFPADSAALNLIYIFFLFDTFLEVLAVYLAAADDHSADDDDDVSGGDYDYDDDCGDADDDSLAAISCGPVLFFSGMGGRMGVWFLIHRPQHSIEQCSAAIECHRIDKSRVRRPVSRIPLLSSKFAQGIASQTSSDRCRRRRRHRPASTTPRDRRALLSSSAGKIPYDYSGPLFGAIVGHRSGPSLFWMGQKNVLLSMGKMLFLVEMVSPIAGEPFRLRIQWFCIYVQFLK